MADVPQEITTATIGTVVVDASVNEVHTLTAEATEHAVEQGSDVSDHNHVRPILLSIQGLVSNHPIALPRSQAEGITVVPVKFSWEVNAFGGPGVVGAVFGAVGALLGGNSRSADAQGFSDEFNRVFDAYAELDRMLANGELITIATALATYPNMMLQSVVVNRNGQTGDALPFTATAKQIRIVSTQTVAAPPDPKDTNKSNSFSEASGGQAPGKPAGRDQVSLARQIGGAIADAVF